jgi:sigma-B regulation protein RsbU (phosphoserine phosphatase)
MSSVTETVDPLGSAKATILVVDDSPVNLRLIVRTLEGRGYRLLAAKSARAALDIARQVQPDLILLDVMMPEMDGFEVCRALKSDPQTRDAIIVFLSALGEVSDKVTGLELGASDYITKPIQAEEVIARVANHVARQQLEREVRRNRDRLEHELTRAGEMQRLILPATLPSECGVSFAAYYRTSLYAGGDYYDVITLPDQQFGIIVADVSGHGAPAAIVMAMIRAAVHAFPGFVCDPAEMVRFLNRHFEFLWESPMFATALSALVEPRAARMTIACAGHPPPLLLQPGDRILFYTDGVPERHDPDDDMYDHPRFTATIERTADLSPQEQVRAIIADVDVFARGREPDDDQTLLLMAVETCD